MKKLIVILCIFSMNFMQINGLVPFKQAGKVSYQGLIEQANNNDIAALKALNDAWTSNSCPTCPEAANFNFIGEYLTKKGYSQAEVAAKLAALNTPSPSSSSSAPVAPAPNQPTTPVPSAPPTAPIPPAPTAPPIAPGIPIAPAAPGKPNVAKPSKPKPSSREELLEAIRRGGNIKKPGTGDAGTVKGTAIDLNKLNLTAYEKEIAPKLIAFNNSILKKNALKKRIRKPDKEKELVELANEIDTIKKTIKDNTETISKNIARLTKDKNLSAKEREDLIDSNEHLEKSIESSKEQIANLEKERKPIVEQVLVRLNIELDPLDKEVDHQEKIIKLIDFKKLTKQQVDNLLEKLTISGEAAKEIAAYARSSRIMGQNIGSSANSSSKQPAGILTPEDLARMRMAGAIGGINKPSSSTAPKHTVDSPLEKELKELKDAIDSFDRKNYGGYADAQPHVNKARKIYNALKDNTKKRNDGDRLTLVKALNGDLSIINKSDTGYKQQVRRSKTDNLPSIFINFEEAKAFL